MKQFTVSVKNKAGALASVCGVLAEKGINIRALATEATGASDGHIKLIPDNDIDARTALTAAGFKFDAEDVITVDVIDEPGSVAKITKRIADAGINIKSFYLLDRGLFAMVVDKNEIAKTKEVLKDRIV